jgi:hypothetical protein
MDARISVTFRKFMALFDVFIGMNLASHMLRKL